MKLNTILERYFGGRESSYSELIALLYDVTDLGVVSSEDINEVVDFLDELYTVEIPVENTCNLDGDMSNDCEDCVYGGEYHASIEGICIPR